MKISTLVFTIFSFLISIFPLHSQTETPITVRVIAHDAKLIGTSMGGVNIIIRDAETGMIYATGLTEGGTGDTEKLVLQDKSRYGVISTPGSAAFHTTLSLTNPVFAEIEATFQTAYTGQPITKTQTQWLIPGKEMTGDGIVMDMPGFAMRIQHPLPHQSISLNTKEDARIDLFMIMLCGCPISPGGIWDSNHMDVEAMVYEGDDFIISIPFENTETNRFTADLSDLDPGSYRVFVSAYDPRSKNTGVEKIQITVKE